MTNQFYVEQTQVEGYESVPLLRLPRGCHQRSCRIFTVYNDAIQAAHLKNILECQDTYHHKIP